MRPESRGAAPKVYVEYGEAQPDLIAALGRFCSYCGRFIAAGVHVEHKRSRERYSAEELLWSNFLLACGNCNSCKGARRMKLSNYLWPDTENTLRAFRYVSSGIVRANLLLPRRLRRKASRTISLLGLDRVPGSYTPPTNRDLRWEDRRTEWNKAELFRDQLRFYDTPDQRELVVVAASNGIFSIWWTVFEGDIDMRRRLRQAFVGTDAACFDGNENLLPREGGQV